MSELPIIVGSLLLALSFVLIFRWGSNTAALAEAGERATGFYLELGIYRDEPGMMLTCLWDLTRASLTLARHLLFPSLLCLAPLALILPQLASRSQYRPLLPGEATVVSLSGQVEGVTLEVAEGLSVEAKVEHPTALYWRVRAHQEGRWSLVFRGGERTLEEELLCGRGAPSLQPTRHSGDWEVRLDYPDRTLWWGDTQVPWWLPLLFWVVIWGLAFQTLLPRPSAL